MLLTAVLLSNFPHWRDSFFSLSHTNTHRHTYVSVGGGGADSIHQQLCRGACPQEYDKEEAGISSSRGMFSVARPVWLVRTVLLPLNCTPLDDPWLHTRRKKRGSCYTACCENALRCIETESVSIIHNPAPARTRSWNCHKALYWLSRFNTADTSYASF